jgi:hypothetical protein
VVDYFKGLFDLNLRSLGRCIDEYFRYADVRWIKVFNVEDLENREKYFEFIENYVPKEWEYFAKILNSSYQFTRDKIIYDTEYTDSKGVKHPLLVETHEYKNVYRYPYKIVDTEENPFKPDFIPIALPECYYVNEIDMFALPPHPTETMEQQQKRLRHTPRRGYYVITLVKK